jgi:hypothetical protein
MICMLTSTKFTNSRSSVISPSYTSMIKFSWTSSTFFSKMILLRSLKYITLISKMKWEVTYKWWLKTQKFETYIILWNYSYYWIHYEFSCINSSFSTSGTHRATIVTNLMKNEKRTGECLRQVKLIDGHLWHRYSVTVPWHKSQNWQWCPAKNETTTNEMITLFPL